jgi:type IV secretion system protein TrbF
MFERMQALFGVRPRGEEASSNASAMPLEPRYRARTLEELFPQAAGALEWSERSGSKDATIRMLLWVILVGATALGAAVWGCIHFAGEAKFLPPYVVQTDRTNFTVAIAPAERAGPVDERLMIAAAAKWIRAMRTVIGNAAAQESYVKETYSMLSPESVARRKANEWFVQHNPMVAVGTRVVEVEITNVFARGTPLIIEVDFIETSRDSRANDESKKKYRATITFVVSPPKKLAEVLANPLGIYVSDYVLSQV